MNYKLAKQLYDAGFPFKENDSELKKMCLCTKKICDGPFGREFRINGELYSEPTLDELIDACGENFNNLERWDEEGNIWWQAYPTEIAFIKMESYGGCPTMDCCGYESGDTRKESVAKLYLALNKKPT